MLREILAVVWKQLSEPPTCYLAAGTALLLVAVVVAQIVMAAAR